MGVVQKGVWPHKEEEAIASIQIKEKRRKKKLDITSSWTYIQTHTHEKLNQSAFCSQSAPEHFHFK